MTELTIRVYGRPAPQGSHDLGQHGYIKHASNYLDAWRAAVNRDTRKAYLARCLTGAHMPLIPYPRPVYLSIIHIVGPEQCRAEGTDEPTGAPDLDKLLRATVDGLGEANAFGNDSQVTGFHKIIKARGNMPGALIIISDRPPADDREIAPMDEYQLMLSRVTRDKDGDRVYETTFELFGSPEQLASVGVATVAILLGRPLVLDEQMTPSAPATAAINEHDGPDTVPLAPKKRAPKKAPAAPPAEPAAQPAEAAAPAPAGPVAPAAEPVPAAAPQTPAQPVARVNPFAK